MPKSLVSIAACAAALAASACGSAPPPASRSMRAPTSIEYDVAIASSDPWVLDVRVKLEGGAERGALAFPPAVKRLVVEEGGRERTPDTYGRSWKLDCTTTCIVRYAIDLSAAAELTAHAPTVASTSSRGDVIAPGSTWLLRPEPVDPLVPATLRVDARDPRSPEGEPFRFAAPFPKDEATGAYRIVARDIGALGYTAFGRFSAFTVTATKGTLDVIVLQGRPGSDPRAADDRAIERWISATARSLDSVFGRFPIDRVLVAIERGQSWQAVESGRTVPAGGASIHLFMSDDVAEIDLHDDWVLGHELVHLGIPSMARDGTWLDEGLATYYQPLLRARAGVQPEKAAWTSFQRNMPRGVATPEHPHLSATQDHDRVYYGGSAFALAADVEIRRRTGDRRSLDDGLRRALAEGAKATDVWPLEQFIAALDRGTGVPVVRELFERTRSRAGFCAIDPQTAGSFELVPCAPDDSKALALLFERLGVRVDRTGETVFDDAAPLAGVRRSIGRVDEAVAAAVAKSAPRVAIGATNPGAKLSPEKP